MVISHITKALAKASAKKMTKKTIKGGSTENIVKIQKLKKKAGRNVRRNAKPQQDEHVKANRDFELDDFERRHDGQARFDRMTNQMVDPDSPDRYVSQDLNADFYSKANTGVPTDEIINRNYHLDEKRLEIRKAEKLMESTNMVDEGIPGYEIKTWHGTLDKRKANLAQYKKSNYQLGDAHTANYPFDGPTDYFGKREFLSPNKIIPTRPKTKKSFQLGRNVKLKPISTGKIYVGPGREPVISKVKKKLKKFNEVDPVTGGYRYGGMNPKSQAGKRTGRGNQGRLKKFWDDWLFPQD